MGAASVRAARGEAATIAGEAVAPVVLALASWWSLGKSLARCRTTSAHRE